MKLCWGQNSDTDMVDTDMLDIDMVDMDTDTDMDTDII